MNNNDIFFLDQYLKQQTPNRENFNLWIVVQELEQGQPKPEPIFEGYAQKFLYDNSDDLDLRTAIKPLLMGSTRSVVFSTYLGSQYRITRH